MCSANASLTGVSLNLQTCIHEISDMQCGPLCLILKAFPCEKYGRKEKLMVGFNGSLSLRVGQLIMKWCHCLLTWWKMCKWMRPDHKKISLSTHTLFPLLTHTQVHSVNNKVAVTQILTRCCYLKWRCYRVLRPHPFFSVSNVPAEKARRLSSIAFMSLPLPSL